MSVLSESSIERTNELLAGGMATGASSAAGGVASWARLVSSAASVNATSAKASAGRLYQAFGYNASGSVIYLKIYNKATAPTVGTDTPVLTVPLPPSSAFVFDFAGSVGAYFSTGIAYGLTTDSADAGTTAVAAGAVLGLNLGYA